MDYWVKVSDHTLRIHLADETNLTQWCNDRWTHFNQSNTLKLLKRDDSVQTRWNVVMLPCDICGETKQLPGQDHSL